MMLNNKNAILYGVGDSLGGAVARAFSQAGARVFLSSRRIENAERVAQSIRAEGGRAEVDQVDALDERAVRAHAARVLDAAGSVDISFNLINIADTQDIPLVDMEVADFVRPVSTAMLTQFLTTTAAARIMQKQKSGVILTLTASPGGIGYARVGGFGPACCALEGFSRDLAAELGPDGVRVVNLRSAGSPDSQPFLQAMQHDPARAKTFLEKMTADTMLKRLPMMQDIAQAAVFLASDYASKITGTTLDVTVGTTSALNSVPAPIAFVKRTA